MIHAFIDYDGFKNTRQEEQFDTTFRTALNYCTVTLFGDPYLVGKLQQNIKGLPCKLSYTCLKKAILRVASPPISDKPGCCSREDADKHIYCSDKKTTIFNWNFYDYSWLVLSELKELDIQATNILSTIAVMESLKTRFYDSRFIFWFEE